MKYALISLVATNLIVIGLLWFASRPTMTGEVMNVSIADYQAAADAKLKVEVLDATAHVNLGDATHVILACRSTVHFFPGVESLWTAKRWAKSVFEYITI